MTFLTQEDLDKLRGELSPGAPDTENDSVSDGMSDSWRLAPGVGKVLGIHLASDVAELVLLSGDLRVLKTHTIPQGYAAPDLLGAELGKFLTNDSLSSVPVTLTISGDAARFTVARAPKLSRNHLLRMFRLEMKSLTGEERDDFVHVRLGRVGEQTIDQTEEHLVATIQGPVLEKLLQVFRRLRLRVLGWDVDALCYARAAVALWAQHPAPAQTSLAVVVDWRRCQLLILGADGRLSISTVNIGIEAFTEQLRFAFGEPEVNPAWLKEGATVLLPGDTVEDKKRKALLRHAIRGVYAPFLRQIQLEIHGSCNERRIPPPSRFTVVGPAAGVFDLAHELHGDLGMPATPFGDWQPGFLAAAIGAALWERHPLRVNFLPKGARQNLQLLREMLQNAKEKWGRWFTKEKPQSVKRAVPFRFPVRLVGAGAALLTLAGGIPAWQAWKLSGVIQTSQAELASLQPQIEKIGIMKKREEKLRKMLVLKESLRGKQTGPSRALKEFLFSLPPEIRLDLLSIRNQTYALKGVARTQADFESFLEKCGRLNAFSEATPVNIVSGKERVLFELVLKTRS